MQPTLSLAIDSLLTQIRVNKQNTKRRHFRHEVDGLVLFITQQYEPGEIPTQSRFFPVRCRNLSCNGVSFFFPTKPSFKTLIVQLGNQENDLYIESEVVHVDLVKEIPGDKSAWDSNGQKHVIRLGPKTFEVGCRFLHRLPIA